MSWLRFSLFSVSCVNPGYCSPACKLQCVCTLGNGTFFILGLVDSLERRFVDRGKPTGDARRALISHLFRKLLLVEQDVLSLMRVV